MTLSAHALPAGSGVVVLTTLLLIGLYLVECAIWPYVRCRCCHGGGIHTSPDEQHWRDCRSCAGAGKRHRLGRRVWGWIRRR
jgi:hypothetical protein